ncbi:MAG: SDR family oxidoreductase [Actinomycetota bacterium]|nr:SDR family oxidoreductase [Actinomycetota bacterium]
MQIFVTGASGWIGSAAVAELLESGHHVVGLARSDTSAERLEAAGAAVQRGDLTDPANLAAAAARSDGVLHLGFQHDVAWRGDFVQAAANERAAVEAMGAALAGSDRPFVLASGMIGLARGRPATEDEGLAATAQVRNNPAGLRAATALLALSLRGIGVRSRVLRFPPTVHGDGDHGFIRTLVQLARERGVAAYVGEGTNRWAAVHRSDAARLARLALESAPAGSVLHAVADEGVALHVIAETMARHLELPTASLSPAQAVEHFGHLGHFVGLDSASTASSTRALLGWEPKGPSLLEDLEADHYYRHVP